MNLREMIYAFRALLAARIIQKILWGENDGRYGLEEWRRMFRKRWAKIDEIKTTNPHWSIEMKKRLLQNAALSIALMSCIDKTAKVVPVTNLDQYSETKTNIRS